MTNFNCDYLIVGAGVSGATVARILAENNFKVTVVEKRPNIAGNTFDYYDNNGILVQKYGPHIFHTNEKLVFDFLSRFTDWFSYKHKVLALVDGTLVPVP
ncbi:MAG: FAD-dependent oxidoreductase, partial [Clostridia bacterium]|nr:FAD-dependent oxidoreductase [Clostridia bacterium]